MVEWMLIEEGWRTKKMRCVSDLAPPPLRRGHLQRVGVSHQRRVVGADSLRP